MFNSSLGGGGGGGGGGGEFNLFLFFSKIQLLYLLTYTSYSFIYLGFLHEFFFLSFVCFMSHMSEFDALLACRRSF